MTNLKVVRVNDDELEFEGGIQLSSNHEQDCCENHFLDFTDISLDDFNGLEFDLSNDNFFNRIDGYGIELVPTNGMPVKIPGHGWNNGYYSSHLDLTIHGPGISKTFNITECQQWHD